MHDRTMRRAATAAAVAVALLLISSASARAQSGAWRVEAAAALPASGEIHLGLFNDGAPDGFMRLGWRREGEILYLYDRTMMPSGQVYESMNARVAAGDLAPAATDVRFHQGPVVFAIDVEFAGGRARGMRGVTVPPRSALPDRLPVLTVLPEGTLLRTVSFVLPLALPQREGHRVEYPWYVPMEDTVEQVTLTARDGGTIETPGGSFETMLWELRGGSTENDIYVSREETPRVVRIDVIGQPLRFLAMPAPEPR